MDEETALRMFELRVEDCLIHKDCAGLAKRLHKEGLSEILVVRLNAMVTKELALDGFRRVCVLLKALKSISEKNEDLNLLLKHGLGTKVLSWFETVCGLLTSERHRNTDSLQSLTGEFYDYFVLLGQPSLQVSVFLLSTMLLQLAGLVLEPDIPFSPRLEAIRTYNCLLESLNKEERKWLQIDIKQHRIIDELAASILTVGDYELQVSISEALCRMTHRRDRQQRANQWFSSHDIIDAFCKIRDGDFEVDCRRFLNYLNCSHGNQRRVYTFPCLRAFLGNTELFRPKDDELEHFWIDVNLGSECISFFIDDQQCFLWGSVHLQSEGVQSYSLYSQPNEHDEEETVLSVVLSRPVVHHNTRGTSVQLSFSSQQHTLVLEAVSKVFSRVVSQEPKGFLHVKDAEAEVFTPKRGTSTYCTKSKTERKQKVHPLSSPSSDENFSMSKPLFESTPSNAEILFDQIIKSIPDYEPLKQTSLDSGLPADSGLAQSAEETDGGVDPEPPQDSEDGGVSVHQRVLNTERKRTSPGSETSSEMSSPKKKAWPSPLWEEPDPPLEETPVEFDSNLGPNIGSEFSQIIRQMQENITAATESCRQRVEGEVVESFTECQQNVTSLLKAVHQHRLLLLQRFHKRVVDHINQLEDMLKGLSNMETEILNFLRSEVRSLASFCHQQTRRLVSLEDKPTRRGK